MELYRIDRPEVFDEAPEAGMDFHFATIRGHEPRSLFIVIGSRVAFELTDNPENPLLLDQKWRASGLPEERREDLFEQWLRSLRSDPGLRYIAGPLNPLPPTPARPAYVYGHLPFGVMTASDTVIYRWEAFPFSRRIDQAAKSIAADTYAAPASEVPFVPTGFGAVARFALPNLMPACYRWELQPQAGLIECGAAVPLYGQSGGGVEVKFPKRTQNRCAIADPVILPVM